MIAIKTELLFFEQEIGWELGYLLFFFTLKTNGYFLLKYAQVHGYLYFDMYPTKLIYLNFL